MAYKCDKCNRPFKTKFEFDRHKNRKTPCDAGGIYCPECQVPFTTKRACDAHQNLGRCKGKEASAVVEDLQREVEELNERLQHQEEMAKTEMEISAEQQQQMSNANKNLLQDMTMTSNDMTALLQENRHFRDQIASLQQELQVLRTDMNSIRTLFSFNVEDINYTGLYLIEISGIVLDSRVDAGSIVVKLGRATERTIGKRAHDTLKKHSDNRILYLRRCNNAGSAEDKLKAMLRMFKMLQSGTAGDGTHGIEFAAFQPGQAAEVKQMFDLAVFQADASANTNCEVEKLKLQLDILKEQRALSEKC